MKLIRMMLAIDQRIEHKLFHFMSHFLSQINLFMKLKHIHAEIANSMKYEIFKMSKLRNANGKFVFNRVVRRLSQIK